jgi:hypothetical protein
MIDLADTELEDLLGGLAKYHGDPLGFVTFVQRRGLS